MRNGRKIVLGELMPPRSGSVDPSRFPAEVFDLYSIPAFDAGRPDIVQGNQIGSTKQVVEPGDVLLSKIVPHIRRSWVVGQARGRRLIASGEWIVFRGPQVHPDYLRHVLSSDPFHAQFMRTVSGVGGSLLRARPSQVASIEVPVPPLAEQRRIASILDQADALRAKRCVALALLDTLTQSIFLGMFGDPNAKGGGLRVVPLEELCSFLAGFAWRSERFSKEAVGLPIVRIQNVDAVKEVEFVYWPDSYDPRFVVRRGDILLTLSGSFRVAEWTGPEALLNQRIVRVEPKPAVERPWLLHAIRLLVERIEALGRHALVNNVAISDLKQLKLVSPSSGLQRAFCLRLADVEKVKTFHTKSLAHLDTLFASLQHRAFQGQL